MAVTSRIGTPEDTSAENDRDQRARAIFWTVSPIFIGTRSLNASHWGLPQSDFFHLTKPNTSAPATMMMM